MAAFPVLKAFLYGVFLGILWECASMLLGASLVEHLCGTVFMSISFVGPAVLAFSIASCADLARPLVNILAFRLTAQLAMTLGTGSVLLSTMLHDTPQCASGRLRTTGWRAPALRVLRRVLPRRWIRRILGVEPPFRPPFLRVFAAALSQEWLVWLPSLGLPSLFSLPGEITFKPGESSGLPAGVSAVDGVGLATSWLSLSSGQELAGVYTYTCQDMMHGDFHYLFRYHAFWMRPATVALLHALGSLLIKMLLMHAYAALFMLLAQANCRDAYVAELRRRADRFRRLLWPRPPVCLIAVEPGDLCAFCQRKYCRPRPTTTPPPRGLVPCTTDPADGAAARRCTRHVPPTGDEMHACTVRPQCSYSLKIRRVLVCYANLFIFYCGTSAYGFYYTRPAHTFAVKSASGLCLEAWTTWVSSGPGAVGVNRPPRTGRGRG